MTGIHPLSLNFWVNEASGEVALYNSENLAPKNIGIDTEIASISVSVAKLIVLPVWDTVSTSGLHLIVFSIVGRGRRKCKWIGHAQMCVVAAEITLKCLHVA